MIMIIVSNLKNTKNLRGCGNHGTLYMINFVNEEMYFEEELQLYKSQFCSELTVLSGKILSSEILP